VALEKARLLLGEVTGLITGELNCYKENEHFFKVIDPGIKIIEERKEISIDQLVKEMKLKKNHIESLAKILERREMIKIEYGILWLRFPEILYSIMVILVRFINALLFSFLNNFSIVWVRDIINKTIIDRCRNSSNIGCQRVLYEHK